MIKKIAIILLLSLVANADMTSFFNVALENLKYDKTYSLYEQSNKTSQNAITYSKYANFNANASYSMTNSKHLTSNFNTTDIALHDTIDLFGKNNYKIKTLRLDQETKRSELNLKKEQLFISLANMIALYNRTSEQLILHQNLYNEQKKIYQKLEALAQNGDMAELDILRFKNTLTTLQTKIASQTQEAAKMKEQLQLYAPKESIPSLQESKLLYTKKDFLAHNPLAKINRLDSDKLIAQSKGLNDNYIPTIDLGVTYQKLDDPTSYGDNHSFVIALHMPLNSGDFKEAEALRVAALSKKTQSVEYKLQRENEYIHHIQAYINAEKQLDILQNALEDYKKSEETIKKAYVQQYVDFNTYLQVLKQALDVKKQIINMKYQKILEATIINAISKGAVYE